MQRAFTLAEISTVIAIIGITGGIAASSMADQIKDARAGAGAQSAVGDLREEYRQAREQLKGLRFRGSVAGGVAVLERVTSCAAPSGVTVVGQDVRMEVAPGFFCINPDGSVVDINPDGSSVQVHAQTQAASEPLVMIRSEMSGGRESLTVLRLDPVGFSDLGSRQDTAAGIDGLVSRLRQDGVTAFPRQPGTPDLVNSGRVGAELPPCQGGTC